MDRQNPDGKKMNPLTYERWLMVQTFQTRLLEQGFEWDTWYTGTHMTFKGRDQIILGYTHITMVHNVVTHGQLVYKSGAKIPWEQWRVTLDHYLESLR